MKNAIILVMLTLLLVAGCSSSSPDAMEHLDEEPHDDGPDAVEDGQAMEAIVPDAEEEVEETEVVTEITETTSFCEVGATYNVEAQGSSSASIIIGLETYKGSEYCKAESVTEIQGMSMTTTYYFNEAADDLWTLTNVAGQVVETHIVDGELVS